MQCGKTAGRLSTVTMDYELKRYLSKFTALVAELRKKKESDEDVDKLLQLKNIKIHLGHRHSMLSICGIKLQ